MVTTEQVLEQAQHINDTTEEYLEQKGTCSTVFFDVAQVFDEVWHERLKHKIKNMLWRQ